MEWANEWWRKEWEIERENVEKKTERKEMSDNLMKIIMWNHFKQHCMDERFCKWADGKAWRDENAMATAMPINNNEKRKEKKEKLKEKRAKEWRSSDSNGYSSSNDKPITFAT